MSDLPSGFKGLLPTCSTAMAMSPIDPAIVDSGPVASNHSTLSSTPASCR